ncbi:MAG: fibronectin type III domain-containing protein [Candidatus Verstraetearchaeota archaeon]|nr:fibronectin type III domain-containing protein [Candidatus Verstraetearchaeota archaeon]
MQKGINITMLCLAVLISMVVAGSLSSVVVAQYSKVRVDYQLKDEVKISWLFPVSLGSIEKYVIYRNGTEIAEINDAETTSYVDDSVLPDRYYNYTVKALRKDGSVIDEGSVTASTRYLYGTYPGDLTLSSGSYPVYDFKVDGDLRLEGGANLSRWIIDDSGGLLSANELHAESCEIHALIVTSNVVELSYSQVVRTSLRAQESLVARNCFFKYSEISISDKEDSTTSIVEQCTAASSHFALRSGDVKLASCILNNSYVSVDSGTPLIESNKFYIKSGNSIFGLSGGQPVFQENTIVFTHYVTSSIFCEATIKGNKFLCKDGQSLCCIFVYGDAVFESNLFEAVYFRVRQGACPTFTGNTFGSINRYNPYLSSSWCIWIEEGGANIENNIFAGYIEDPAIMVYDCADGEKVAIHYNSFCQCERCVVNWDSSVEVDATYNWWGYKDGPTTYSSDPGQVAMVAGNVKYEPWLEEGICLPNFKAVCIEVVQAVTLFKYISGYCGEYVDKIAAGKPFALRLHVDVEGISSSNVQAALYLDDELKSIQSAVVKESYTKHEIGTCRNSINFKNLVLSPGEHIVVCILDPDDKVWESLEWDNKIPVDQFTSSEPPKVFKIEAVPVKKKSIAFMPLQVSNWKDGGSPSSPGEFASEAMTFFKDVFPVNPGEVSYIILPAADISSSGGNGISTMLALTLYYLNHYGAEHYDFLVGILPYKVAEHIFGSGFEGASFALRRNAPIVSERYPETVAHELGHYYGLDDEYSVWWGSSLGHLLKDVSMYRQSTNDLFYLTEADCFYCLMGCGPNNWIEPSCYKTLLEALSTSSSYDPEKILLVGGAICDHGPWFYDIEERYSANITFCQLLERGSSDLGASSEVSSTFALELVADNGSVLQRHFLSGDPFASYQDPPSKSYDYPQKAFFLEAVEYVEGTASIRLVAVSDSSNITLCEYSCSENPPSITLLQPNGGEFINGTFEIEWTASDPDGDSLSYTVLYSYNGGATWVPIAINITKTSLSWNSSNYPGGTQCLVQVIASDGFYTAIDKSNGYFQVPDKPPFLKILYPFNDSRIPINTDFTLQCAAVDLEDGNLPEGSVEWFINGSSVGYGSHLQISLSTPGIYNASVEIRDSAGNAVQRTVMLRIVNDTAPPQIAGIIMEPELVKPNHVAPDSSFTVLINVTDIESWEWIRVEVSWRGENITARYNPEIGLFEASLEAPSLSGEFYNLTVVAVDHALRESVNTTEVLVGYILQLEKGWNLVSFPVDLVGKSFSELVNNSVTIVAYYWDDVSKRYEEASLIEANLGYWIYVNRTCEILLLGETVDQVYLHLERGWHLIAIPSTQSPVIFTTSEAALCKPFFTWDQKSKSYVPAAELQPLHGYWVYTAGYCVLRIYAS